MADRDPRLKIIADALTSAGGSEMLPADQLYRAAEELLVELDMHSPDATVRRLQRDLWEAWGNDAVDWNLARAMQIVDELESCRGVLDALKRAFQKDGLDGGWKSALDHPLYLDTGARMTSLETELKGLV